MTLTYYATGFVLLAIAYFVLFAVLQGTALDRRPRGEE